MAAAVVSAPCAVTAYADAVLAGEIVAGPYVRAACERHQRDLIDGPARGLRFDGEAAQLAIDFIEAFVCREPGVLFLLEPWQRFIVGSLFGWYNRAGYRRFRVAYIEIGKGNGKTPLAAAIGLYGLVMDSRQEPAAEIYSAATTREQANICFRDAHIMAESSPALAGQMVIGQHNLALPRTHSFFRPVSSEHRGLDGKRVHMALIDEVHEHPNGLVVQKIRAGTKGRQNALIVLITNSGYDLQSICWQYHQLAVQVVEGRAENDTLFGYVCALDQGDDWRDEAVWPKANPNLGVSINYDYLREQVREAEQVPANQSLVRRLNFCVWTEASAGWLDLETWDACAGPVPWQQLREAVVGRRGWLGVDLATTMDIAAVVGVYPADDEDGQTAYDVVPYFFIPADNIQARVQRSGVGFDVWVREGALIATEGNVIDYDTIESVVGEIASETEIEEAAYDPWNATGFIQGLMASGMTCVPIRQGFASMSAPTKALESLVLSGRIRHGGHPVLRWMAGNVVVATDPAGNVKPAKDRSGEKIDGIVALINALARAVLPAETIAYVERPLWMIGDDVGVLA